MSPLPYTYFITVPLVVVEATYFTIGVNTIITYFTIGVNTI